MLGDSQSIVISPDGLSAYSGDFNHGISIFDRDPGTGLLTQKSGTAGCISNDGNDNTGSATCGVGRVLGGSYPIVISPTGGMLYVPAFQNHGLAIFKVNPDGTLSQPAGSAGCITIDGKDQNGSSTCTVGRAINAPYGAALSGDGSTLYVTDDSTAPGGIAAFSLNRSTGQPTQLPGLAGCITSDGSSNGPGPVRHRFGAERQL